MENPLTTIPKAPERIGLASDHGGFELKQEIRKMLREAGYKITDFGSNELKQDDDYPDYVIPLANAVAKGDIDRGIAVCGSGVGACIVANKVQGVRACLIHDNFSAHQGVEDDDLNIICLGGRVLSTEQARELVTIFLASRFSGAERHRRRLYKIAELESNHKSEHP